MSYLEILQEIEKNDLTVEQALKRIEKESKKFQVNGTKKLKIQIKENGKFIMIPAIPYGMIKYGLKACPPIIKLIKKYSSSEIEMSAGEVDEFLDGANAFIGLMKNYPPIQLVTVKTEDSEIYLSTK